MGRLDGKRVIISGGARGMGLETGRLFADEGARVMLADVLDDEGKNAASSIGDAVEYVHLDVTDEHQWVEAIAGTERLLGGIDVLVNNAGILRHALVDQMPVAEYLAVINVNQLGVFLGMRAAVPAMKRAGGGSIVNIASVEGIAGSPGLVAYCASKFAVRGMTKAAAVELGPANIRVNAICPGAIDTPMVRSQGLEGMDIDKIFGRIPAARAGRPLDVARMSAFLASDESSFCTGQDFIVDGGATSFIGWRGAYPKEFS